MWVRTIETRYGSPGPDDDNDNINDDNNNISNKNDDHDHDNRRKHCDHKITGRHMPVACFHLGLVRILLDGSVVVVVGGGGGGGGGSSSSSSSSSNRLRLTGGQYRFTKEASKLSGPVCSGLIYWVGLPVIITARQSPAEMTVFPTSVLAPNTCRAQWLIGEAVVVLLLVTMMNTRFPILHGGKTR